MDPKHLRYAATHERSSLEGDQCTLGITQFAVDQLTDIVFVDLPDVGDHVFQGDSFGEIESVKAVSELYPPVNGEVVSINEKLIEDPSKISSDPNGKGWMIKIKGEPGRQLDHLKTLEKYHKQITFEQHLEL